MLAVVDQVSDFGDIRCAYGSVYSNGRHRFFAVIEGEKITIEAINTFDRDVPEMPGHEKLEAVGSIELAIRLFLAEPVVAEEQILSAGDWKSRPCSERTTVAYLTSASLGMVFCYERETKDLRSAFGAYVRRGLAVQEIMGLSDADKLLWSVLVDRAAA